ncbi:uncharacterized protein EKO05_0001814 [Ascochyta rabiei]|nr:uncharacterized protein EKO05_0001814 [Ascochyta rabiei]UPX11194.1 hypothetical protein EKO05_0001814 [Ascochyta rabiei]
MMIGGGRAPQVGALPIDVGTLPTQVGALHTRFAVLPIQAGPVSTQDGQSATQDDRPEKRNGRYQTPGLRARVETLEEDNATLSAQIQSLVDHNGNMCGRLERFEAFMVSSTIASLFHPQAPPPPSRTLSEANVS